MNRRWGRGGGGLIPPEEAEDGNGDGESDERERVAHRVHGLHVGEVHVGA